nr:unnamed protein product [Spirometra erinaceieuropaei]
MRIHLHSIFVDSTETSGTVNRKGLWKVRRKLVCPEPVTQMVRQLHDGMTESVKENGVLSKAFTVTNGVMQGCVVAPTLFNLKSFVILLDAYRDERPNFLDVYWVDGHLLNHRQKHLQSRVCPYTVHELPFADDCALNNTSGGDIQRSMDLLTAFCDNIALVINTEKKMVMHRPPLDATYNAPQINANDVQLQVVDKFAYLGGTLPVAPRFPKPAKSLDVCKTASATVTVSISTRS